MERQLNFKEINLEVFRRHAEQRDGENMRKEG